MTGHTKSEWTDHRCNRRTGCRKASRAWDHCYAEQWAKRSGHPELWEGERRRTTTTTGIQAIKWDRAAAGAGARRCVFFWLRDVFDNQAPARQRRDLWHRIEASANLDWLLLTKRSQKYRRDVACAGYRRDARAAGWPGISAGNQEEADRNIAIPLATAARVQLVRRAASWADSF
jgi:protein gp37